MRITKKILLIILLMAIFVSFNLFSFIVFSPHVSFLSIIAQMSQVDISAMMKQIELQVQNQFKTAKDTSVIPTIPDRAAQNISFDSKKEFNVTTYNFPRDLLMGSQGEDVATLQKLLIEGGYLKISKPTTSFGPMTKTALSAWQRANGISPSGYFGPLSRTKIIETAGNSEGLVPISISNSEVPKLIVNNDPTTFIKTYHIWDATEGFGVTPLKNGGYLLTGDIISGAGVYYPFVIKTNNKGDIIWSKRSSSPSNVYSVSSSRHIGRLVVETTDGSIVMVSDTPDFVDAKYEEKREAFGDVLVAKLDSKGEKLWSIMFGDFSIDQPQKIWATQDGGVMVLSRFTQTGFGNNVGDTSVLKKYSVLTKIDKNGQVLTSKKMDWDAIDMKFLADGSFVALASITIPKDEESQIMDIKTSTAPLPTILKLNSALNVEWAKTMEMIPSELSFPTGIVNGKVTMVGITKVRMPGGDFKAIQPTSDGGFIAFGYAGLLNEGMIGTSIGGQQLLHYIDLHPFIAVKVDATGKYLWARKLTGNLFRGSTSIDFQVAKTLDNGFVILQEVVRDKNWQKYEGNAKAIAEASATNIELVKTDTDFNPRWIKKIDVEKDLFGYDIQPTADKGVVVAGMISTNKTRMVFGSPEPYSEAILIKTDVNGGVAGCTNVSDHPEATVEDQSQYLIMQDMKVTPAQNAVFGVNKKVEEKVSTVGNISRNICEYKTNNVMPISSFLNSNIFTPQQETSVASPVAKTWMQINFDNTKEAIIEAEKNRQIHVELLPILNKIFNNQVKIKNSENSGWMTYIFPRIATRTDVEAVQRYFEGLGYRIDESEKGTLNVSKVGLSLRMTFYINNTMKGELDVMF